MRRRDFVAGTAAMAAMGFTQPTWAQTNSQPIGVKRLAIFHPVRPLEQLTPNGGYRPYMIFFDELNRLGYVEGRNLVVERYSALGQPGRFGGIAREIIASRPDVILPMSGLFTKEIMAVTISIPMVGPTADPAALNLTSSLARPDRNFTGVVLDGGLEIWAKRVQLLLEVAPNVTKVGWLVVNPMNVNVGSPGSPGAHIREAAQRGGVATAYVIAAGKIDRTAHERFWSTLIVGGEKVDPTAYQQSFDAMQKEGIDGLIVGEESDQLAYRKLIADLAVRFRIPAMYPYREFVDVGGLMAYGGDVGDLMRRIANMIGQVLSGAKVSDIPFYRQTKFELVLNQRTATSLGLRFPATMLTVAADVIE